jgi:hypothetical protein
MVHLRQMAGILLALAALGAGLEARAGSNLVFRLVVVNPSATEVQPATVKSYLPKEVKTDDIVNKGDLQAIYDAQQGSYFVYGEIELKPGEVWEQQVELRDVWFTPDAEIQSLKAETAKYGELVKGTEFAERVGFLTKSINEKLADVERTQKLEPSDPERRIAAYRESLKTLDAIRMQIADIRSLMAQSRPFSMGAVWGMILAIVVFLGILGATFYFVWFRQVRSAPLPSDFYTPPGEAALGPVERQDQDRKGPSKDLGKVLGEPHES